MVEIDAMERGVSDPEIIGLSIGTDDISVEVSISISEACRLIETLYSSIIQAQKNIKISKKVDKIWNKVKKNKKEE